MISTPPSPTGLTAIVDALPTFHDDFSAGRLDTSKWIPSNWNAPGAIAGVHKGVFSPNALDFSEGMLRIKVTQTKDAAGVVQSIGGELQSKQKFGFGSFEWIMRASATASGAAVSGQISSGFIFQQDNGYTEIDCPEIQGQAPDTLSWSSYVDDHTERNVMTGFTRPEAGFHSYRTEWRSNRVDFYVDDELQTWLSGGALPQNPAFAMINHWGTNSTGWGGMATVGVDRFMYVKRFSFTAV